MFKSTRIVCTSRQNSNVIRDEINEKQRWAFVNKITKVRNPVVKHLN